MSDQSFAHDYLQWTKQKLDEIDATLAKLDNPAEQLSSEARTRAEAAIAAIRAARDTFKAKADGVRANLAASKQIGDEAFVTLEVEWSEVERAFQNFLKVSAGQADLVRRALADRANAQRQSVQASVQATLASAADAVQKGRSEVDAALRRLSAETAKTVEAKVGQVSAAGDESWKALKSGLDETLAVYDRTWKQIADAFGKIR